MTIAVESRPLNDAEVKAGEIYRLFRSTNKKAIAAGGKLSGDTLEKTVEERTRADIAALNQKIMAATESNFPTSLLGDLGRNG